jgi:nitric oxide reductase NorQ protein
LADTRRVLSIDKINEQLVAHQDFHLIVSYNPGYQNITKDMKTSTRQRFAGIEFGFPQADVETEIVVHESGLGWSLAHKVVAFGERTRHLKGHGLEEGASTRMLIHAASLIAKGLEPYAACHMAVVLPIADDPDMVEALNLAVTASF